MNISKSVVCKMNYFSTLNKGIREFAMLKNYLMYFLQFVSPKSFE